MWRLRVSRWRRYRTPGVRSRFLGSDCLLAHRARLDRLEEREEVAEMRVRLDTAIGHLTDGWVSKGRIHPETVFDLFHPVGKARPR